MASSSFGVAQHDLVRSMPLTAPRATSSGEAVDEMSFIEPVSCFTWLWTLASSPGMADHDEVCTEDLSAATRAAASQDCEGRPPPHEVRVDLSERSATLLDLVRQCADFEVRMEHLTVGDYIIDGGITVERKTYADFATSLVDGRLFTQAAILARCPHRPVILLEGPRPSRMRTPGPPQHRPHRNRPRSSRVLQRQRPSPGPTGRRRQAWLTMERATVLS